MDTVLTSALLAVGLKDDHDITRNFPGDCLFLCFVQAVRKAEREGGLPKNVGVTWTHGKATVKDPEQPSDEDDVFIDITSVKGLRQIAASHGEMMCKNHVRADLLQRYINNRFSSATVRQEDAKVEDYEPPADDAPDSEYLQAWGKLMMYGGVLCVCALPSEEYSQ